MFLRLTRPKEKRQSVLTEEEDEGQTWSTTAGQRRTKGEVDVFLRVQSNDERGNIHHLLSHTRTKEVSGVVCPPRWCLPDVSLTDEHTGMMDALRQCQSKELSLQTTF